MVEFLSNPAVVYRRQRAADISERNFLHESSQSPYRVGARKTSSRKLQVSIDSKYLRENTKFIKFLGGVFTFMPVLGVTHIGFRGAGV